MGLKLMDTSGVWTAYRVAMELYDSEREAILEAPMWGEKDKIRPEDLEVT